MRKIAAVVMLLLFVWMFSGCNTVHGLGKDVESGGKAIERSSGK